MTPRKYATPQAFKAALEQRVRKVSRSPMGVTRRRQLLVFDRYLARLARILGPAITLKGGLVLELRLERARTTRDIDLRFIGPSEGLFERLQAAGRLDLGDYMLFEVRVDPRHPDIAGDGVQYEGQRFRAECRLAGMLYGQPFGVDIAIGDPLFGEPEVVLGDDLLAFAGIAPPEFRIYPVETHLAEKLHAYTLPRATPNTRVKDLPDLALLAQIGPLEAQRLRAACSLTFSFRKTHPIPMHLPQPPTFWAEPYAEMAMEDSLPWKTLEAVTVAVRAFLDPMLSSDRTAHWNAETWSWI